MRATLSFFALVLLLGLGCVQQPVTPEMKCNDSEAAADIYHYGYVTYDYLTYLDTCEGASRITEYYCEEDKLKSELKDCPEGYKCSEGACAAVPCTDSDGGNEVYEKGTATKGEASYADYCIDNSVVEYYCTNDQTNSIVSRCPDGYVCSDGACVISGCEDTESGRTSAVAGTVTKDNTSYTDYCSDSRTVFEYYCADAEVAHESLGCSSGYSCSDGICALITECSDSDSGQDQYTKGITTKGATTETDYCTDSNTVSEYYCSGGNILRAYIDCSAGYSCSDGKCTSECYDSDGGQDRYVKGTATLGASTHTDYCTDTDTVREYYCSPAGVVYTSLDCPTGYSCSDGRCVTVAPACIDTDGTDIYTYGHITQGSSVYYDSCFGPQVREYWCNGSSVEVTLYSCPSGYACSGGKCVASCYDTDGAKDAYVHGTVWVGDSGYADLCADSDNVKEYFCLDGSMSSDTVNCPSGYVCSSGVCVVGCEETDGGNDPRVAGITSRGIKSYGDVCLGNYTLVEYYCAGDSVSNVYITCLGAGCVDNSCTSWLT